MSSHNQIAQPAWFVENPDAAWDIANAEKPYRELESHARQLNLGHIATDMAQKAVKAGESVQYEPETESFPVRSRTFEGAKENITRSFSNRFIESALTGGYVGIKTYLDRVPVTVRDKEVVADSDRIAGVYAKTSEVVRRNLKLFTMPGMDPARKATIKTTKDEYLTQLGDEIADTEQAINDWCNETGGKFPMRSMEYLGFQVEGIDILDASKKSPSGVDSNIKVQRQGGGNFIMGYSKAQMIDKANGKRKEITNRIYLNPDLEVAPEIFEQVLQMADERGIPLQLKMFQQAPDLATLHRKLAKGQGGEKLRGDGVVVYVDKTHRNEVLEEVLKIAEAHADAFTGRLTSRIPTNIAPGIAIGDEPKAGSQKKSLTSHRAEYISAVADVVHEAGLKGAAAHDRFRRVFHANAAPNGIDPDNLAFNA